MSLFCRGPGGRGPWPGPNTNSVSRIFRNHFKLLIKLLLNYETILNERCLIVMFSNPSLRPADSVLLFIARELRGELIWDHSSSFYLTFSYLTVAVVIFFPLRSLQGPPGGGGPPGTPIMPSPGGASPINVPCTSTCVAIVCLSVSF